MKDLPASGPQGLYYLAYQVTDRRDVSIAASFGALIASNESAERVADIDLRVGTYELDNTRRLRGESGFFDLGEGGAVVLPLEDDQAALRAALWLATDRYYKSALEQIIKVRADRAVKVDLEDDSADFSRESPATYLEPPATLVIDRRAWEEKLRAYSRLFRGHPEIHFSQVQIEASAATRGFVSSEGGLMQTGRTEALLRIYAATTADDGMELSRLESLSVSAADELADDAIRARIHDVIADLEALRRAPVATPYVGPAILEGRTAGVFFHEIFGHRVEGHRQKDEEEGQTFTHKIGERIMPAFIDIYDDPSLAALGHERLGGFYLYDDEGMPAMRATLVEAGVFRGFLLSRSPIRGFARSNGHGRPEPGNPVVARQANLVVQPRQVVPAADLRRLLLAEVKRQGRSYGLRFSVVEGGYTATRRHGAQAFKVLPVMVYRVYLDGREELVRGADLEGTPLTSLSRILAAGDDSTVFNGFCGAESGFVPVAAVSPSVLLEQVEIARSSKGHNKPPLLPAPPLTPASQNSRGEDLR